MYILVRSFFVSKYYKRNCIDDEIFLLNLLHPSLIFYMYIYLQFYLFIDIIIFCFSRMNKLKCLRLYYLYVRSRVSRLLILLWHVSNTFMNFSLWNFSTPGRRIKVLLSLSFLLRFVCLLHSFVLLEIVQSQFNFRWISPDHFINSIDFKSNLSKRDCYYV